MPGPYGPESEHDTPRVYKTIYAHDFDFQSLGSFEADYISVEHSTGLDLQDEFIIKVQSCLLFPFGKLAQKRNNVFFLTIVLCLCFPHKMLKLFCP